MKNRLTPEDLDDMILSVEYLRPYATTMTICVLTLSNGCVVEGKSNVIDPVNFDNKMGEQVAYRNAKEKIWELEGYALKRASFDLVQRAAKTAHEINRIHCEAGGDVSQKPWDDAPDWQKSSAYAGIEAILANPGKTPEQSHESWMKHKDADGWVYGDVKDVDKKTHPCMVPYDQLDEEQQRKDHLFTAIVNAVTN